MGHVSPLPHASVAVGLLAALGALLLMPAAAARPHADRAPAGEPAAPVAYPAAPAGAVPAARPQSAPPAEPFDGPVPGSPSPREPGRLVLRPAAGSTLVVRARPRGPVVARLGARTQFGSPTTLLVAAHRGPWLGVVTTHVPNGRLGWVDARADVLRASRVRVSVGIDLSARRLVVRRDGEVLRRVTVGIGRPSSPTPVGRFAVTDKLSGARYGSYYGCCIVALSANQPNLPPGWRGGDRIAVHGTDVPSSVGAAVSAGCPRARDGDLRYLVRIVPLGAPVVVRR